MNETDTFADDEGQNDEYFDFEDISGKQCVRKLAHHACCCKLCSVWSLLNRSHNQCSPSFCHVANNSVPLCVQTFEDKASEIPSRSFSGPDFSGLALNPHCIEKTPDKLLFGEAISSICSLSLLKPQQDSDCQWCSMHICASFAKICAAWDRSSLVYGSKWTSDGKINKPSKYLVHCYTCYA